MNKDAEQAKQVLLERIIKIATTEGQESPQPFAQAYKTLVESELNELDFHAHMPAPHLAH